MEQHIKITGKIGAIAAVASSMGADVWPIICGQFIETYPMILMYLTFGTLVLCFLVFLVAIFIGKRVEKEKFSEVPQHDGADESCDQKLEQLLENNCQE